MKTKREWEGKICKSDGQIFLRPQETTTQDISLTRWVRDWIIDAVESIQDDKVRTGTYGGQTPVTINIAIDVEPARER